MRDSGTFRLRLASRSFAQTSPTMRELELALPGLRTSRRSAMSRSNRLGHRRAPQLERRSADRNAPDSAEFIASPSAETTRHDREIDARNINSMRAYRADHSRSPMSIASIRPMPSAAIV